MPAASLGAVDPVPGLHSAGASAHDGLRRAARHGSRVVRAGTPHHTTHRPTEDGGARRFTQATESSVIRPAPQNAITHRRRLDSGCNVTYIT